MTCTLVNQREIGYLWEKYTSYIWLHTGTSMCINQTDLDIVPLSSEIPPSLKFDIPEIHLDSVTAAIPNFNYFWSYWKTNKQTNKHTNKHTNKQTNLTINRPQTVSFRPNKFVIGSTKNQIHNIWFIGTCVFSNSINHIKVSRWGKLLIFVNLVGMCLTAWYSCLM